MHAIVLVLKNNHDLGHLGRRSGTVATSLRQSCCSWLCCGSGISSAASSPTEDAGSRASCKADNGVVPQQGTRPRPTSQPTQNGGGAVVYEVTRNLTNDVHPGNPQNPPIKSCSTGAGRKVSPISNDVSPATAAAVIRTQKSADGLNGDALATVLVIPSAPSTSSGSSSPDETRKSGCGAKLEGLQNKLTDFWTNNVMSGGGPRRYAKNSAASTNPKYSLQQHANSDEALSVLASRGSRSLPVTCRPVFPQHILIPPSAESLKLAPSPAALEMALESMHENIDRPKLDSRISFTGGGLRTTTRSSRSATLMTSMGSPTGELPDSGLSAESPAPLPSFLEILGWFYF
ncbi:hypothetical protein DdX_01688 [Ditylenchus destructor]|uniref:Uncharacterized protein n=1 Tax=Ditylenchus destructor TaxID=166010 RepID=A0AAD4NG25_9BILA|nr:hypothetical protein DdX_01688 [Ditylenchus destructor]